MDEIPQVPLIYLVFVVAALANMFLLWALFKVLHSKIQEVQQGAETRAAAIQDLADAVTNDRASLRMLLVQVEQLRGAQFAQMYGGDGRMPVRGGMGTAAEGVAGIGGELEHVGGAASLAEQEMFVIHSPLAAMASEPQLKPEPESTKTAYDHLLEGEDD